MRTTSADRAARRETIRRAVKMIRRAVDATSAVEVAALIPTGQKTVERWYRGENDPTEFTARVIIDKLTAKGHGR